MKDITNKIANDVVMEQINAMKMQGAEEETELQRFGTNDIDEIVKQLYIDYQSIAKSYYGSKESNFDTKKVILQAIKDNYIKESKEYNVQKGDNKNKQSKYSMKYDSNNTKRIYLKLNVKTDKEILERLDKQDNKQGYIKELIRKDIKKG